MENNFRKDVFAFFDKEKSRIQGDMNEIQNFKDQFYQSRGNKFLKQSSYVLLETIVWVIFFAEILWLVFLFRVPPFHKFSEMMVHVKNTEIYSSSDLDLVDWSVKGLVVLIIIATFIIARQVASMRKQISKSVTAGHGFTALMGVEEQRLKDIIEFETKYAYLIGDDIKIELEDFKNPLLPPEGDRLLDENI